MYCLNAYTEEVSKIKVSFKLYVIVLSKNLGYHSFLLWINTVTYRGGAPSEYSGEETSGC